MKKDCSLFARLTAVMVTLAVAFGVVCLPMGEALAKVYTEEVQLIALVQNDYVVGGTKLLASAADFSLKLEGGSYKKGDAVQTDDATLSVPATLDINIGADGSFTIGDEKYTPYIAGVTSDVGKVGNAWKVKANEATPHASATLLGAEVWPIVVAETANGSVKADPDKAPKDERVSLIVTPDAGYELDTLTYKTATGDSIDIKAAMGFVMPGESVTVTATFKPIVYTVKVKPDIENGTVTVDKSTAVVGEKVLVEATPANGYRLGQIEATYDGGVVSTEEQTLDLTMPASNVEVTATFYPLATTATLTFGLAEGTLDGQAGTVTITANVGDTIKLPDAPTRDGYTFHCWKDSENADVEEYEAGAEYEVKGDRAFIADWRTEDSDTKDYPEPEMSNSEGGVFASKSDEITYTITQGVPNWVTSIRTWVDLDSALQFTSSEGDIRVSTVDGTPVDAKVTIDGQRLTVEVTDATALHGKTLTFSYKARLRPNANLDAYLKDGTHIASVPYQAHTVFDGDEEHAVESTKEYVKFSVGSANSGSTSSGSTTSSYSTSKSSTPSTGDPTSVAALFAAASAGVVAVATGWRKRR